MQHDTTQQHSEGSLGSQAWSQDEVNSLHVGLLLFGSKDFFAINQTLLPHRQVGQVQQAAVQHPSRVSPDTQHRCQHALIKHLLLQVEDIVHFYCSKYAYTKASTHVAKLEQSGFQPGALVSGNTRKRVLANLQAGV